jgi:hypothetical protein
MTGKTKPVARIMSGVVQKVGLRETGAKQQKCPEQYRRQSRGGPCRETVAM